MTSQFPELVLGGAAYAGLYQHVGSDCAADALAAAWDAGIRAFDTAPHYGVGLSEERLGAFLTDKNRSEYTISTKVGRILVDDPDAVDGTDGFFGTPKRSRRLDYSASGVRRSLEGSLDRLGIDAVDLLLIHDPDDHQEDALDGAAPELARMRDEGIVDAIGVGVNDADVALRFVRDSDIDHVLIAGRYTLLDRRAEKLLLEECAARGIAVLVAGVLNSGLLADPSVNHTFDYTQAPSEAIECAVQMQRVCAEYGVPLRSAALQFPLRHRAVHSLVIGAGSEDTVTDTITQLNREIPLELWARLDALAWCR
ncbi:aldo/keto reductase [Rhodococcus sp. 14-1411-2a]|uniref:aldo/keto reductase n=1 Tax=Rhodococcus sp. 14-1411-2a TaxID=2023151 RepID=UPI000B9B4182|nr:aldo/keto reductase [Rhodococcus sp. 14-1411-2a]OZF52681.1 aldo/keto reductase [Rhodococcus sp. 14-1411-2a]